MVRDAHHNMLPNIVGIYPPRNDDPDRHELYCALMLMLFRPWRSIEMLKTDHVSWTSEFENYAQQIDQRTLDLMDNLQYLHRSEAAAQDRDKAESGEVNSENVEREEEEHDEEDLEETEDLLPGTQTITSETIEDARRLRVRPVDALHGQEAVAIGEMFGVFTGTNYVGRQATVGDVGAWERLERWQNEMWKEEVCDEEVREGADADVVMMEGTDPGLPDVVRGEVAEEGLTAVEVDELLEDQRRAYDIVTTHLDRELQDENPPQLLMLIVGEGGTGKTRLIQTITEYFKSKGVERLLVKSAYTGIAASLIDGKTTHTVAALSVNNHNMSEKTKNKLTTFWNQRRYLVIDEVSMISRRMLALISQRLSVAKATAGMQDLPFGGINVILAGDFHQFPPVATKKRAPLYYEIDIEKGDTVEECTGRETYEMFQTVVILKEQVRVTDPGWLELLQAIRYGNVTAKHVDILNSLVLTNPACPNTDFSCAPWTEASLVTPRHAVRIPWNNVAVESHCKRNRLQMFVCPADDTIRGRRLGLEERLSVALKRSGTRAGESKSLPDDVTLSVGMKVMVTLNVDVDADITNGARGVIEDIVLDPREPACENDTVIRLTYPPCYLLVKLSRTRLKALHDLPEGVIPIQPATKSFTISTRTSGPEKKTVKRRQFPITGAYAFTDYRAQGQTLPAVIVDIANPPQAELSLCNIYVALSRSRGRETIRLLREFDKSNLFKQVDEALLKEDERLDKLDRLTRAVSLMTIKMIGLLTV